jgi:hypothetical protein
MKLLHALLFSLALNVTFGLFAHFGMSFEALVQGAILMFVIIIWMEVRS